MQNINRYLEKVALYFKTPEDKRKKELIAFQISLNNHASTHGNPMAAKLKADPDYLKDKEIGNKYVDGLLSNRKFKSDANKSYKQHVDSVRQIEEKHGLKPIKIADRDELLEKVFKKHRKVKSK